MHRIQIFHYLEELGCFVVAPNYKRLANYLGLNEWNEVVWIGRYFSRDNDFGEHWFDNWDLREPLEVRAAELGLDSSELLIIDPERFADGRDGPCHSPAERASFWHDVLLSLHLSLETLFREARKLNAEYQTAALEAYIPDLEARILAVQGGFIPQ